MPSSLCNNIVNIYFMLICIRWTTEDDSVIGLDPLITNYAQQCGRQLEATIMQE